MHRQGSARYTDKIHFVSTGDLLATLWMTIIVVVDAFWLVFLGLTGDWFGFSIFAVLLACFFYSLVVILRMVAESKRRFLTGSGYRNETRWN